MFKVGADGGQSLVRQAAGIDSVGWDYGQVGIVATVEMETSTVSTAWQRFLPSGPVALLPVSVINTHLCYHLVTPPSYGPYPLPGPINSWPLVPPIL